MTWRGAETAVRLQRATQPRAKNAQSSFAAMDERFAMAEGMESDDESPLGSTSAADAAAAASNEGAKDKKQVVKPLSKKRLEKHLADAENRGVVYFSRIPPFLKPDALRTMLSGMGTEVLRIFLTPETKEARASRVKGGGNKKKSFGEGWVEFEDKRRAKRIASTLNNTQMTNNKRSFYFNDLWNCKYLHKFKWSHLTEKQAYEARVRRDKMVAELSAAKKESAFYMRQVDKAKMIDAMEAKKKKRQQNATAAGEGGGEGGGSGGGGGGGGGAASGGEKRKRDEGAPPAAGSSAEGGLNGIRRNFRQRKVAKDGSGNSHAGLLGNLFGRKE